MKNHKEPPHEPNSLMPLKAGVVILAAGASTRMGQSKQLLPINSVPMLAHAVKVALDSEAEEVTVVLGANAAEHRASINHLPVNIVENKNWEQGMGSSLKAGLKSLVQHWPYTDAVVFMVCDQPAVTTRHIDNLINHYRDSDNEIVASFYGNNPGVPAVFGKKLFSRLMEIGDDEGAKKVMQEHKSTLMTIAFPEGTQDLDTWDDYEKFTRVK